MHSRIISIIMHQHAVLNCWGKNDTDVFGVVPIVRLVMLNDTYKVCHFWVIFGSMNETF